MAAVEPTAQDQISESNPDYSFNPTSSSEKPTTECGPFSPAYSSEPDVYSSDSEVYILDPEDVQEDIPDPKLQLIDEQFNLKMKELLSQSSSGQLVPYTVEATLQQISDGLLHHLAKSHPLTWISYVKSTPEEDELPLWMSIMKEDIDVLVTQFQQQMCTGFRKMMREMVTLYHKKNNEVSKR